MKGKIRARNLREIRGEKLLDGSSTKSAQNFKTLSE
jgi:hypothetical protein